MTVRSGRGSTRSRCSRSEVGAPVQPHAGASVAQGQLPDSIRTRVDAVFSHWDRTDSPGCALGISQGGREVYARGYGMSDLQHAIAITPSSNSAFIKPT